MLMTFKFIAKYKQMLYRTYTGIKGLNQWIKQNVLWYLWYKKPPEASLTSVNILVKDKTLYSISIMGINNNRDQVVIKKIKYMHAFP